ncbi:MAG: FecR domain-containing protein [Muribaculaceae bacterium]|nr:FecR domain-containing protein [Muribaculaceae bacterium]
MSDHNTEINKCLQAVRDSFRLREKEFTPSEINESWLDCELRIRLARRRRSLRRAIVMVSGSIAASIALLLWFRNVDVLKSTDASPANNIYEFAMANAADVDDDVILNIIPGCDTAEVNLDKAFVNCLANGSFTVNGKAVEQVVPAENKNDFCQLVVPKGRRAEITFADGTHLWANSNSKVVYPRAFSQDCREIFVKGEVYLDVAHDSEHPFIVRSRDFEIEVLGTSFNVMDYDNGIPAQVVLVSGKIELSNADNESVVMNPGQLVDISNSSLGQPEDVDVTPYVSWKDNILIYNDKALSEVFDRLNICYGKEFVVSQEVADIRVSGKLYLKENVEAVLRTIAFSTPIVYEEREGQIYVSKLQ